MLSESTLVKMHIVGNHMYVYSFGTTYLFYQSTYLNDVKQLPELDVLELIAYAQ